MVGLCFLIPALLLLLGGCAQAQSKEIAPDIPRYTADQVISVAEALYPEIPWPYEKIAWEAIYMGEGIWRIHKYGIGHFGSRMGLDIWDFHEDTGALTSPRPPVLVP